MARAKASKRGRMKHRERCAICKVVFDAVTAGHLRTHGYTIARYERLYGARRPDLVGSVSDPARRLDPGTADSGDENRHRLVTEIAERLTDDRVWLACVSDEVGERMLSGPMQHRLSMLLTTMLAQRATVHGQAMAVLSSALTELHDDWRITQGGKGGGPTETDVLLRIVEKGAKLVKESEDAVTRTMKLALDEQRQAAEYADALGPALYQGTGETLAMPAGMPAGDRETIRNLLSLVGKAANDAGTIDAVATPVTAEDPPGEGAGGTPLPPPAASASSSSTEEAPHQGTPSSEDPPSDDERSEAVDPCPTPKRRRTQKRGSVSDPDRADG